MRCLPPHRLSGAVTALVGALAFGLASPAPAATPNLSGSWRLNPQRSDDAAAAIAEASGSEYMAGTRREVRVLPTGKERSEVERLAMREWLIATAERARTEPLVIEQDAREVKLLLGDLVRIFYFGREASSQDARGVRRKTRMSWKGEQLLIEETGEDKLKMTHLYTLLPDGQSLIAAFHLEGGELKKPLDLKLLFDRIP
jgi:hypothetical protein